MPPLVLVIDDSMVARRQVQLALDDAGLRTETAGSLEAGLLAALANPPQLVVLDDSLPDGSLADALQALANCPPLRGVPVILLTARPRPPAEWQTLGPQVRGVLCKPLDRVVVRELVESVLVPSTEQKADGDDAGDRIERVRAELAAVLESRLTNVPLWEQQRHGDEPQDYYFSRLFPAGVVRELAERLTRANGGPSHLVAIWETDREHVTLPLIHWLDTRYGLQATDLTTETDPRAAVRRLRPSLLLCDAVTIGPDSLTEPIREWVAADSTTKVVITCPPSLASHEPQWRSAGVAAVLIKPYRLNDLARWLPTAKKTPVVPASYGS